MLRIGRGITRAAVRKAFAKGRCQSVTYRNVLGGDEIREAVAGVREAGSPKAAQPLLAWLASHPNAPEDVLRDLARSASREILISLAMNENLPGDLHRGLLNHEDEDVRAHAHHTFARTKRH